MRNRRSSSRVPGIQVPRASAPSPHPRGWGSRTALPRAAPGTRVPSQLGLARWNLATLAARQLLVRASGRPRGRGPALLPGLRGRRGRGQRAAERSDRDGARLVRSVRPRDIRGGLRRLPRTNRRPGRGARARAARLGLRARRPALAPAGPARARAGLARLLPGSSSALSRAHPARDGRLGAARVRAEPAAPAGAAATTRASGEDADRRASGGIVGAGALPVAGLVAARARSARRRLPRRGLLPRRKTRAGWAHLDLVVAGGAPVTRGRRLGGRRAATRPARGRRGLRPLRLAAHRLRDGRPRG